MLISVPGVVDDSIMQKPLGTEALLLGALPVTVAGVQGTFRESWCLLDTLFSLGISACISVCLLITEHGPLTGAVCKISFVSKKWKHTLKERPRIYC